MPPPRLVPLWRSSRCLAVRPLLAGSSSSSSSSSSSASSLSLAAARVPTVHHRLAVTPTWSVRRYADDATTRIPGEESSSSNSTNGNEPSPSEADVLLGAQKPEATEGEVQTSSSTEIQPSTEEEPLSPENQQALLVLERLSKGLPPYDVEEEGHMFGLTSLQVAEDGSVETGDKLPNAPPLKDRYNPAISQMTRLLMRDGKLAKAQRDMALVLNYLQTSPAPKLSPVRRLLPGHPPASQLPLDPVRYLTLVMDSVGPLVRMRSLAGLAGGGRAFPVPSPLDERQRRRTAFMWLLELVQKRQTRGSGRGMLAQRIGEEIVAVAEGKSSLWDKREQLHKLATASRANVMLGSRLQQMQKQK